MTLAREQLRDHLLEAPLTEEEVRLNRAMKQQHPYYNVMSFPDPLDRTSRTVTALCTRVSRESIVVNGHRGRLRRLTLRERSTLQGFPITFQFCGRSYTDRLKMIGNAIPPLMTFFIGQALLGIAPEAVKTPRLSSYQHPLPAALPPEIEPRVPKRRFAPDRRFRAVIPHLRFGSGMRFEMANSFTGRSPSWEVAFYFGTSKNIRGVKLDEDLLARAAGVLGAKAFELHARAGLETIRATVQGSTSDQIQEVWTHRASGVHPFKLVDGLGVLAERLHRAIPTDGRSDVEAFVLREVSHAAEGTLGRVQREKLRRNAGWIWAGFVVGSWFNSRSGLANADVLAEVG